MSFEPLEYLRHIVAEADYLAEQAAANSKESFLKNETLREKMGDRPLFRLKSSRESDGWGH